MEHTNAPQSDVVPSGTTMEDESVIVIPRDYSHTGNYTRFDTKFPPQLAKRDITPSEFEHTISQINNYFIEAESINFVTFLEGFLGCLSLFTIFLCYDNRYKKVVHDLESFLTEENKNVYRKKGLEILNPIGNGLLELEIRVLHPKESV
mmetsp:Transcript_21410/g.29956  ORF Transcript_21410/g.29956 Transcript_21410/m.29956 type:complete len:149 (-) Transcript_21410:2902-3348(-)